MQIFEESNEKEVILLSFELFASHLETLRFQGKRLLWHQWNHCHKYDSRKSVNLANRDNQPRKKDCYLVDVFLEDCQMPMIGSLLVY